jgi:hypothetical protein
MVGYGLRFCTASPTNGTAIAPPIVALLANRKFAEPGGVMENMAHDSEQLQEMPEQKLWRAVIASTVQEWIHGPLRKKREAEKFLFLDMKDYRTVCYSAGLDPTNLRERLEKIRSREVRSQPIVSQN